MSFDASMVEFLDAVTPKAVGQRRHPDELERLRTEKGHLQRVLVARATIDRGANLVDSASDQEGEGGSTFPHSG